MLTALCRTRLDPGPPWSDWAAGQVMLAAAAVGAGYPDELHGRSWEIAGPGHRIGVRQWPMHPDCGCARLDAGW